MTMLLLLIWVAGIVGFLLTGWTARSYVGERWLPHLAAAWTFGPFVLTMLIAVATLGISDGARDNVQHVANGLGDFALYGVLTLMLVLIGRQLPEATPDSPSDSDSDSDSPLPVSGEGPGVRAPSGNDA